MITNGILLLSVLSYLAEEKKKKTHEKSFFFLLFYKLKQFNKTKVHSVYQDENAGKILFTHITH